MTDTTTRTEDETTEPSVPHLTWITVGCCPRCGRLFTSSTAFKRHWATTFCVSPEKVKLVSKPVPGLPGVVAWCTGGVHPDG